MALSVPRTDAQARALSFQRHLADHDSICDTLIGLCAGKFALLRIQRNRALKYDQGLFNLQESDDASDEDEQTEVGFEDQDLIRVPSQSFLHLERTPNFGITFRYRHAAENQDPSLTTVSTATYHADPPQPSKDENLAGHDHQLHASIYSNPTKLSNDRSITSQSRGPQAAYQIPYTRPKRNLIDLDADSALAVAEEARLEAEEKAQEEAQRMANPTASYQRDPNPLELHMIKNQRTNRPNIRKWVDRNREAQHHGPVQEPRPQPEEPEQFYLVSSRVPLRMNPLVDTAYEQLNQNLAAGVLEARLIHRPPEFYEMDMEYIAQFGTEAFLELGRMSSDSDGVDPRLAEAHTRLATEAQMAADARMATDAERAADPQVAAHTRIVAYTRMTADARMAACARQVEGSRRRAEGLVGLYFERSETAQMAAGAERDLSTHMLAHGRRAADPNLAVDTQMARAHKSGEAYNEMIRREVEATRAARARQQALEEQAREARAREVQARQAQAREARARAAVPHVETELEALATRLYEQALLEMAELRVVNRPADHDAEVARAAATRAANARAEGSRAEGSRAEGSRAEGSRAEGSRAEGSRAEGSRAEGSRAAGYRAAESRPTNTRAADDRPTNAHPTNARAEGSRAANARAEGSRPAESRPANTRPANTRPTHARRANARLRGALAPGARAPDAPSMNFPPIPHSRPIPFNNPLKHPRRAHF